MAKQNGDCTDQHTKKLLLWDDFFSDVSGDSWITSLTLEIDCKTASVWKRVSGEAVALSSDEVKELEEFGAASRNVADGVELFEALSEFLAEDYECLSPEKIKMVEGVLVEHKPAWQKDFLEACRQD